MPRFFTFLILPFFAFSSLAQSVDNRVETDCNEYSEDLHSVLNNGQIVLLTSLDSDCETCRDHASELDVFAKNNQKILRVWAAFNNESENSDCESLRAWQLDFGWQDIHFFPDPEQFWKSTYEYDYLVIHPGDHSIYFKTNDLKAAQNKALQLAFELNLTSIDELRGKPLVVVAYPNPFNEDLTLEIRNIRAQSVTVEILDLQGRLLQQKQFENTFGIPLNIQTGEIPKGTYFLNIRTEASQQAFKIFK